MRGFLGQEEQCPRKPVWVTYGCSLGAHGLQDSNAAFLRDNFGVGSASEEAPRKAAADGGKDPRVLVR